MAEKWIMVRVTEQTHNRLRLVRDSLLRAAEQGKLALDLDAQGRVSLDQVIDILCDRRRAHADRRRKARRKSDDARHARQLAPATAEGGADA